VVSHAEEHMSSDGVMQQDDGSRKMVSGFWTDWCRDGIAAKWTCQSGSEL